MAITKNLTIDKGATFSEYINYLDNNKLPISLEGYTVASQMRRSFYSANAITFSASLVDAANGNVQISLTAAETVNIKDGRYVYDVEATSNTTVKRIIEGLITVYPGVTNV
jgi:cytoskeletal protein CcmA (bactofilin family)